MGGHNDVIAHRGKIVLGVFTQSKTWQEKKKTPGKYGRKFKTWGITQAGNALTLLTKKTRQTSDKRKEGLAFIHKSAGQQQDTGETHTENNQREEKHQNCLLVFLRNSEPDPSKTIKIKQELNRN